jgi:hypothetical protein
VVGCEREDRELGGGRGGEHSSFFFKHSLNRAPIRAHVGSIDSSNPRIITSHLSHLLNTPPSSIGSGDSGVPPSAAARVGGGGGGSEEAAERHLALP